MNSRPPHDASYKNIFSDKEMTEGLLRDFVDADFCDALDFSGMEPWPCQFITPELREQREDIIWRIPMKNGNSWHYFLFLLEFQSTVDTWMAVRILAYTALLYQDLIKKGQVKDTDLLPPVFPLVLYNGNKPWTARAEVAELIQPFNSVRLQSYQPHQRHYVLDEMRVDKAQLDNAQSITALAFKLECSRTPEDLKMAFRLIAERLNDDRYLELRRSLTLWAGRVLAPRFPKQSELLLTITDIKEAHTMLAENLDDMVRNIKAEGMAEGITIGATRSLLKVLESKFGPIPSLLHEKILSITSVESLDKLLAQLLVSKTLAEFDAEVTARLS